MAQMSETFRARLADAGLLEEELPNPDWCGSCHGLYEAKELFEGNCESCSLAAEMERDLDAEYERYRDERLI